MKASSTNIFQDGEVTIEQENESLKQQVEELLAKVEAMTKKETDLSYKLAELSDEYKRQGARFKRETEKTKVSQKFSVRPVPLIPGSKCRTNYLGLCHQKFCKRSISSC